MSVWIESHQALADHHKTRKAARLLSISRPAIIGHLHLLWWWAVDAAPDGDLSKFEAADIAETVMWEGDPDAFLDALVECKAKQVGDDPEYGFLERTQDGRLLIHDWNEFAGKLIERRKRDAARKKSAYSPTPSDTSPIPPPSDNGIAPMDIQRSSEGVPAEGARYRTEQNRTEQNIEESPQTPQGDLHEPDAVHADAEEVAESQTTGGKIPPPKHKPVEFKAFYLAYPRHDAPRDAAKAWDQVKPSDEDIRAIDAALSQIQDRRFTRESRVRCKQPGAWLRAERWNSEDPFPGLVVFDEQDRAERTRSNSPQPVNLAIPPGMTIDYEATLARAAAERDRVLATVPSHHRRHHARMGN